MKELIEIVRTAGEIVMRYRSKEKGTEYKEGPNDPVTLADWEADRYIRRELERLFPEDSILSEESRNMPLNYRGRVWIVDPIDGTKNFIEGGDSFSIMIGLCDGGRPIKGVVYLPARNWLFSASKGEGANRLIGESLEEKLEISDVSRIGDARAIFSVDPTINPNVVKGRWRFLRDLKVREIMKESSVGTRFGIVAGGKADFTINSHYHSKKWDTCAPEAILEEAGGRVTDFDGNRLDYRQPSLEWGKSFIASNGKLHEEVLRWVNERINFYDDKD